MEGGSSTMAKEAIPLHLSELDATKPLLVLHWLPRERVHRSCVAELHLVLRHVDEPLVEGRAHEHQRLHPLTSLPVQDTLSTPH